MANGGVLLPSPVMMPASADASARVSVGARWSSRAGRATEEGCSSPRGGVTAAVSSIESVWRPHVVCIDEGLGGEIGYLHT